MKRIIVTASSFAKDELLCSELRSCFPVERGFEIVVAPLAANTAPEIVARTINGFDGVIAGREPLTSAIYKITHPPGYIAKYGVGLDNIAPEVFQKSVVCWEAGVNAFAVAEQTIGLLLAVSRNIASCDRLLREGQWLKNGGRSITGMRVVVIGVGHVGSRVVALLRAFGCEVVGVDIEDRREFLASHGCQQSPGVTEVLPDADVVTLHVPLTDLTRGMVDTGFCRRMKPGSILINTARGQIVDEAALLAALESGHLSGAGLDVFKEEPTGNITLIRHPNVVSTPHTAGNSREAVSAMGRAAIRALAKFMK